MNLYRSLGYIWTGTQADARAAQGSKDFEHIDVPTDKAGLLAFLNELQPKPDVATMSDEQFNALDHQAIAEEMGFTRHTPPNGAPYANGHPTTEHMKSRDPAAKTICVVCGRTPEQAERHG